MSSFSLLRSFSSDTQSSSSTPPSSKVRKMNKRFSFHQRQFQNVKETSETSFKKDKKSNLTRRWSSLKQYQPTTSTAASSQQSLNTTGGGTSSNASPSFVYEKHSVGSNGEKLIETKKKWEVIEHYKDNLKGRETISSSLLAVSMNICDLFLNYKIFSYLNLTKGRGNNFQRGFQNDEFELSAQNIINQ